MDGSYDYHLLVFARLELFVRLGRRICGQMGNLARLADTDVRVIGAYAEVLHLGRVVLVVATISRKSEKTIATVSSSSRKISVKVSESLTVEESRELRALLKAEEKVASSQWADAYGYLFDKYRVPRYWGHI